MFRNLIILTFFLFIIGEAFEGSETNAESYSHFKCVRKHRTYKNGLIDAINKCEDIVALWEVEND